MCALNQASLVIPFDHMPLPSRSCLPIGARCAWQCNLDLDCTNFNSTTEKIKEAAVYSIIRLAFVIYHNSVFISKYK